jgi:hypothetical protein
MVLECTPTSDEAEMSTFLNGLGAKEINVQEAETGWWLGRYDRNTQPFEKKTASTLA